MFSDIKSVQNEITSLLQDKSIQIQLDNDPTNPMLKSRY